MRITCPNCQAAYDVDPSMIPATGRDVQCSNCAHTWFQHAEGADAATASGTLPPPDAAEEPREERAGASPIPQEEMGGRADVAGPDLADDETADTDWDVAEEDIDADAGFGEPDDTSPGDEDEALRAATDGPRETAAGPDDAPGDDGGLPRAGEAGGTPLDDEIADILREEAAFEAERRRSETPPPALEPQGELELDEARPSGVLRERLDRMRGDAVPTPTIAAAAGVPEPTPRRERLPDIEQINSSLRPGGTAQDDEAPIAPAELVATRQSGFRSGFLTVVLAVAIAIGVYVYAPQIVRILPAAEPAMIAYVDAANGTRDRIDGLMARAIAGLNGILGERSNGA